MKPIKIQHILFLFTLLFTISKVDAQDTTKFYIVSGVGVLNGQGIFGKSVQPSIGFNSGVGFKLKQNLSGLATIDFNSLKYSQQNIDDNSPFLFQNTSSSLLMIGAHVGNDFHIRHSKWSVFTYLGGGYLNIGEPRVQFENANTIVQNVVRQSNVFGRGGLRLGYKTSSAFFQTLYLDASYWASPANVQGGPIKGVSLYFGTRIAM
jgi:hypothetical protein